MRGQMLRLPDHRFWSLQGGAVAARTMGSKTQAESRLEHELTFSIVA
jgi:hypothetical protein